MHNSTFLAHEAAGLAASRAAGHVAGCAAEAALDAGTDAILVCGGEVCRDERGARLAARAPEGTLAFFSSGHYKLLSDFDPQDAANLHRARFEGVDYGRLRGSVQLVLDREVCPEHLQLHLSISTSISDSKSISPSASNLGFDIFTYHHHVKAIDTLANFTCFLRRAQRRPWPSHAAPGGGRGPTVDVVVARAKYYTPEITPKTFSFENAMGNPLDNSSENLRGK